MPYPFDARTQINKLMQETIFQRTEILLGENVMKRLHETRVILFGVGGVGGWCAESLIRTGIGHLTMVDFDRVAPSNINRQLPATTETVGELKVSVLQQRLQTINPAAEIVALPQLYDADSSASFQLDTFDYIIDAIDMVDCKIHLILSATQTSATLFSSMGAALKLDPTTVQTAEFWKVNGCPLAAALRRKMRHAGTIPHKKFTCVFSNVSGNCPPKGTVAHVTAVFGFTLAGLVVQDIYKQAGK